MNTNNQHQKNERQKTRQQAAGPKKRGQDPIMSHEHERPELRLTR